MTVAVNDTLWYTRAHYGGTWFDQSADVGAGPFHAEMRTRPTEWAVEGRAHQRSAARAGRENAYEGHY